MSRRVTAVSSKRAGSCRGLRLPGGTSPALPSGRAARLGAFGASPGTRGGRHFIAEALAADSPVAFEPASRCGADRYLALGADRLARHGTGAGRCGNRNEKTPEVFAPENWVRDTLLGGGFVSMRKI